MSHEVCFGGRRQFIRLGLGALLISGAKDAWAEPVLLGNKSDAARTWSFVKGEVDSGMSWSSTITSSLDSLTLATSRAIEDFDKAKDKLRGLYATLSDLRRKRESELEEYRSGLFCSGCNKTRSQILALGENFPHSGQSIIRATPAQIEAKDKELQGPIESTEREIEALEKEPPKLQGRIDAGLEQIRWGGLLWVTAKTFAINALSYGSQDTLKLLDEKMREYADKVSQANSSVSNATAADDRQLAQAEMKVWERLEKGQFSAIQNIKQETGELRFRITERHNQEYSRILGFVQRGKLTGRASAPPSTLAVRSSIDENLGARYLMGRLPDLPGGAERISNVVQFCAAFKQQRNSGNFSSRSSVNDGANDVGSKPSSSRLPKLDALP